MALVTVITPTYNRKNKLVDLYHSLQIQISKNFEWLIVDDGSTDGTEAYVKKFMEDAEFNIRYLRKENGGKHTALNLGIEQIDTDLTFIVDSDDTVTPDGIAIIEEYYAKYKGRNEIGVFSFLKKNENSDVLLEMPEDEFVGYYVEERIRKDRPGDMAEVFLTRALKEYPFPEFPGERFLSEDVVWIPLGIRYKTVFINKVIYRCEYLEDGLTRNDKRHKFASPLGSMMRGKMLMSKECGLKARIKGAIIYNCYKREIRGILPESVQLPDLGNRMLIGMMYPLGIIYNKKWKRIANG